jgi:outer membrane lipoprotein-sorting protein
MFSRLALPLALVAGLAGPAGAQSGPLQLPPASLPGLPALPAPPKPKAIPVPKPRPSGLEAGVATAEPVAPRSTAAAAAPVAAEPVIQQAALDMSPQAVLDRVNASLNAMTQVTADFVQVGGNGRRLEGKLYVQKPGRLRFEYKAAPIEIIADGNSVVIRDRKLGTQDVYPLSQTPLKFLLKDRIDLARDTKVLDVQGGPDVATALIEDRTTFGGTSRVEMSFDPRSYALKQWTVTDPQGYQTTVNIKNVDLRTRPDPELFHVDTQRVLGEGR